MKWYDVSVEQHVFWEERMGVREIIDNLKIPYNSGVDVMQVYRDIVE